MGFSFVTPEIDLVGVSPLHSVAGRDEGATKHMDAYKGQEPCCEPTTDTGEKIVASTSVEQDDRYWRPIRAFRNGYVKNRAAKVELDPNLEWTLLSYKTYRSIGSEVPLRQAEEILETKTGDSSDVVGKSSIVLQLGQFHSRTDVLVVDGLEVDLTLGLVWYERNEDFVFDRKNKVLKTGKKCSSLIEVQMYWETAILGPSWNGDRQSMRQRSCDYKLLRGGEFKAAKVGAGLPRECRFWYRNGWV